jgi:hypothetical protein
MINNLNKNHLLIIFMLFILCILYLKKQETFQNFNRNAFNYNGLVNYNFEPYIYKEKTISELHIITENILEEINKKTNSNLKLGKSLSNYDNINIEKLGKNTNRYLIDVFVSDIKDDYTLRLLMDFDFNKKTKEINVNKITKSNASRLNLNNDEIKSTDFVVNGYNEDKIDFSKFKNQIIPYRQPDMYKKDIMPLLFQEKKCNIKCNNNVKCWNCDGIRNQNPKQCNCDNTLHTAPLLTEPTFYKSLHNKSNDNEWLFSPTRVNLAHNY